MNLFIQEAAERDILLQASWYAERGVPEIARRFHAAVMAAIDVLTGMPAAAPPRPTRNGLLAGLRARPVTGFDEFRVYYLDRPERLTIVRVLHDKRDTTAILARQTLEAP